MPYLISDISDDTELLPVNAVLSNPAYPLFYDLASETVKVLAGANTTEWQVARGVGNTQAVRHSRGTPLVLNASPYGGGGGGVTADNGVDPPAVIANLIVPGASVSGDTADMTGVLQMRLLGPVTLTFNTVGIGTNALLPLWSVADGDIAVGDLIVDVWAELITIFDHAGAVDALLEIFTNATGDNVGTGLYAVSPDLTRSQNRNSPSDYHELGVALGNSSGGGYLDVRTNWAGQAANACGRVLPARVLTSDLALTASVLDNHPTDPYSQGEVRLWAIIARLS